MRKNILWIIIAFIIVIVAVAGWKVYSEYRIWSSPWGTENDTFTMDIGEGKNAHQIADMLKEKGVLHSTRMFLVMADLRGIGAKLRAGEYQIKGTQSPYEILDMLATGKQYYRPLMIPEGSTQLDIAQRCADMEICSVEDFMETCRTQNIFNFVIAQAPGGMNPALEGVLFPDTYHLFRNTPPIKVIDRMKTQFETVTKSIFEEAKKISEKRGTPWWWESETVSTTVQIHRCVVLASMVEKEAKRPEDRPLVASVFANRYKKDMPMQADSTIHYAINDWSRPLTSSDLKVDSAYNTYANPGLPAAAICNPGKESLRAAIMPADSNYLFFISMNGGETKFTADYNEFLGWKNQLKRERKNKAEVTGTDVIDVDINSADVNSASPTAADKSDNPSQ